MQWSYEVWCWESFHMFICLLWWSVCKDLLPILKLDYLLFWIVRVVYFRYVSFFWYVLCKYFLSVCSLSSHSLNSVFCRTKVLNFNQVQLMLLLLYLNTYHQPQSQVDFLQWFLLEALWYCISYTYIICIRACHSFWGNFCEFLSSMCRCFVVF